jgi:hypothetical protein
MTFTLHQNAEKLLAVLKELPPVGPDSIENDFRETVRNLCLQVQEIPLSQEREQRLIPPPFPG